MAPRNTREEAFRAGLENPLMGDIGPLQRLYGTVSAIGSELGGGDMGTPFGQRFAESQKATKAEIKRLQALREKHPEEFGRGMMQAQEQQDPYMLGLGLGSTGAMMPRGGTYSPVGGPAPIRALEGPGEMRALPAPVRALPMREAAPVEPYYRNVPPEMGSSARPMSAYNQNMYGMTTGRYGAQGAQYIPEMAVTDFESYGPMGARTSPESWGRPLSKFDQNMYDAYVRGRAARGGGRPAPMGGDYTLEELGSAPVPYRQGGLVYEPVSGQGAAPRQIGGPQGAPRLGYERGPIEGEWPEVGHIPYGGGYRPNFTMEGAPYTPSAATGPSMGSRMAAGSYQYSPEMAVSPTGMRFDPRVAAGAAGLGYMEARRQMHSTPLTGSSAPDAAVLHSPIMPSDLMNPTPSGMYYDFGRNFGDGAKGGGERAGMVDNLPAALQRAARTGGQRKAAEAPLPPRRPEGLGDQGWEGNLNYQITQMLDRLTGQNEAERGRQTQQYYQNQGY